MDSGFAAQNDHELDEKLKDLGASAPPRLERRGRQKELERFCLRLLLLHQNRNGLLEFPLVVEESENPDLVMSGPRIRIGIEVVEACDPREQAEWTQFAKTRAASEIDIWRDIDLMDPLRNLKFKNLVQVAIDSKAQKCSESVDTLLVYSNTDSDDFEDFSWKKSALTECILPRSRFKKIWIISGDDVFDLISLTRS